MIKIYSSFRYKIRLIDFETVLPFWRRRVWPGRQSPIRPVTTMTFLGGYDMTILDKYIDDVRIFGAFHGKRMIGVTSGHPTSETHFRHRTFYVRPMYQGKGIGCALMAAVEQAARDAGRQLIWGLPRVPMVPFFLAHGWSKVSDEVTEGMEFGPNVYVAKSF